MAAIARLIVLKRAPEYEVYIDRYSNPGIYCQSPREAAFGWLYTTCPPTLPAGEKTRMSSQWQFPLEAIRRTPSAIPLEEEMLRRQRGVDWLMRVGATLNMCVCSLLRTRRGRRMTEYRGLGPCLTAATFLHRFYMRRMLEDYHEYVRWLPAPPFFFGFFDARHS